MNNRIKELAEQAKPVDENGVKICGLNSDYHDQWMENFAKSLIEENARLIDMWSDSGRYETFGQRLKAHFTDNI